MSLRWKLARLRAMEPYEILHRARNAARDRFFPPAWETWSPEEAARRWEIEGNLETVKHRLLRLTHPVRPCPSLTPTLVEGEAFLRGEWKLFGREVRIEDPPNWRANPFDGREWPDAPSKEMDYRNSEKAGGAKYVWELGRLTFLETLATCYALTGDSRYVEVYERILKDFCERNPLGRGIHHTSGIEQAVRNITILFSLSTLLHAQAEISQDVVCSALALCAQQALHCWTHLSVGSSGNNHLVAELAGTVVAGAAMPFLPELATAAERAWSRLQTAVPAQFHSDGVPAEQAFRYLPFVWELTLAAWQAGSLDKRPWTAEAKEILVKSLTFARCFRLPNGELPPVGDEDDGRIFFPAEGLSRLDLAGNALAVLLEAPRLSLDAHALATLLSGEEGLKPTELEGGTYHFPHGGYTLWRRAAWLALWDHGPLGFGRIAAHGHADANMLVLYHGTSPVLADPGTYEYHGDVQARDRFRSTAWHGTVCFGARDQSENLGPFLWGAKAEVSAAAGGYEVRWHTGERHWRRVQFQSDQIRVEDRIAGADATVVFPLGPDIEASLDGPRATLALRERGVVAVVEADGIEEWRLEPMEFSPRFSWKVPSQRLVGKVKGHSVTVVIRLAEP